MAYCNLNKVLGIEVDTVQERNACRRMNG